MKQRSQSVYLYLKRKKKLKKRKEKEKKLKMSLYQTLQWIRNIWIVQINELHMNKIYKQNNINYTWSYKNSQIKKNILKSQAEITFKLHSRVKTFLSKSYPIMPLKEKSWMFAITLVWLCYSVSTFVGYLMPNPIYIYIYIYIYILHTHTHTHTYIYTYMICKQIVCR